MYGGRTLVPLTLIWPPIGSLLTVRWRLCSELPKIQILTIRRQWLKKYLLHQCESHLTTKGDPTITFSQEHRNNFWNPVRWFCQQNLCHPNISPRNNYRNYRQILEFKSSNFDNARTDPANRFPPKHQLLADATFLAGKAKEGALGQMKTQQMSAGNICPINKAFTGKPDTVYLWDI